MYETSKCFQNISDLQSLLLLNCSYEDKHGARELTPVKHQFVKMFCGAIHPPKLLPGDVVAPQQSHNTSLCIVCYQQAAVIITTVTTGICHLDINVIF